MPTTAATLTPGEIVEILDGTHLDHPHSDEWYHATFVGQYATVLDSTEHADGVLVRVVMLQRDATDTIATFDRRQLNVVHCQPVTATAVTRAARKAGYSGMLHGYQSSSPTGASQPVYYFTSSITARPLVDTLGALGFVTERGFGMVTVLGRKVA
ncbi:hypothetical protein ACNQR7_32455 [Mycolicibacterium senegalense]|uniref:hypothetical protein n=1 Tax=Mycolicibacterium senegalense TaxID=1796 RepID=UPI003AAD3823